MKRFIQTSWILMFGMMAVAAIPAYAEEASGDPYALDVCPVSGKKLGDAPVIKAVDGREIRFCCAGCPEKFEADKANYISKIDEQMIEAQKASYPLTTCVVMGDEALGDESIDVIYKNRLVRFCCKSCVKHLKDEGDAIIEKLDAAVKEKQGATYAATVCPVSGEKLGSMGDPTEAVVANRLVKFCCAGCEKQLKKDPAKVLSKLDEATAQPKG
ncbi:MAG: hypothetical protein AMXMBFR84_01960 [Candidatus Hydrogenedentota bacterium]